MNESVRSPLFISLPAASVLPASIVFFTFFNGFYNSMATAFGFGFPFDTFCASAGDLLGDFIKAAISFPGPDIKGIDVWPALYRYYLTHTYGGVAALAEGKLSNLHGMPLPTLLLLAARQALAFHNPNVVTAAFFAGAISPFCLLIWTECRKSSAGAITVLSYLLSYPVIFAVTRGNITAIILGEALATAVFLTWHRRHLWVVALLLAFAVNLRPNAAILLVMPLLRWPFRQSIAAGATALLAAAVLFGASFVATHHLYHDYTLNNFNQAVIVYKRIYFAGDAGVAYGSSLLGGLKFVFYVIIGTPPPQRALEVISWLLGLTSICLWLLFALQHRFERTGGLFTLLAIYSLFSGVFNDYHLIPFFAFVLVYSHECNSLLRARVPDLFIGAAVLIVMAPKNYLFWGGLSGQVLLNPLILLVAALGVGMCALRFRAEPAKE